MNSLQLFNYNAHNVRTVVIRNEPWFVIADICRVLDIKNPTMAAKALDGDDLSTTEVIDSVGRKQTARTTNESGVYQLVFQSRKPEAKAFMRWVTKEVIPSIRKTGSYGVVASPPMTGKELMAAALLEAHATMEANKAAIAALTPKAEGYDALMGGENWWDVRDAAQLLKNEGIETGEKKLFRWMRENNWLGRNNRPLQRRIEQGTLALKLNDYVIRYEDGRPVYADPQARVTPKGLDALRKALGTPQEAAVAPVAAPRRKLRSLNP